MVTNQESTLPAVVALASKPITNMPRRRRWRRELRVLGPDELHDFCPRSMAAEREARKPFWCA